MTLPNMQEPHDPEAVEDCRRQARIFTENHRLLGLSAIAYNLHRGCYTRTRFPSSGTIARNLYQMAELLDALEPLTVSGNGQPR